MTDDGLRILYFGNDPGPAERFRTALALRPEYRGHLQQVGDFADAFEALAAGAADAFIIDLACPGLTPIQAITMARAIAVDLPLITLLETADPTIASELASMRPGRIVLKQSLTPALAGHLLEQIPRRTGSARARQASVSAAPDNAQSAVAVLDREGVIIAVNESWRESAHANGYLDADFGVGRNYFELCDAVRGDDAEVAHQVAGGIRGILSDKQRFFEVVYACHSPSLKRWVRVRAEPARSDTPGAVVMSHVAVTEQEMTNRALNDIERSQGLLFESNPRPMWIVDWESFRFLAVNDAAIKAYGYTREEFETLTLLDIHPPEERTLVVDASRNLPATASSSSWRHRRKNGRVFPVEIFSQGVSWQGRSCRLASVHDLTSHEQAESALALSRDRMAAIIRVQQLVGTAESGVQSIMQTIVSAVRELFQATGAALAEREGEELVFRAVDGELSEELGLRLPIGSSLMGRCFVDKQLLHTADLMQDPRTDQGIAIRLGMRSALLVPLLGQGAASAEVDGVLFVASSETNAFSETDATTIQIMAGFLESALGRARSFEQGRVLLRDRTEALEALTASDDRFKQLVGTAHEGVLTIDVDRRITFVNECMAEMLGFSSEEMRGRPVVDLLAHPARSSAGWPAPEGNGSKAGDHVEHLALRRKDGALIDVSASISGLTDREGRSLGALAMITDTTARRSMEEAARLSQARFRTIVETSFEGVWTLDAEGRTLYANQRLGEMLGCTTEELSTRTIFDFVDEERKPEVRAHLVLRWRGMSDQYDFQLRRKDGTPLWVTISSSPLLNASGSVEAILKMLTDVTGRRLAEATAGEQHELLKLLLEGAGDPVFLKTPDGVYAMVNSATAELFGRTAAQIVGHTDADFLPADDATRLRADDLRVMRTGKAEIIEEMRLGPDGMRTYLSTKTPYRNRKGEIAGVSGIAKNITDRKRTEEVLRKTTEELHNIVQSSPLAIATLNLADQVLSWNPASEKIFGWEAAEVFARPMPTIPPDGRQEYQSMVDRAHAGEVLTDIESRRITKSGTMIDVTTAIAPLRNAEGAVRGTLRIASDVTAQRQLKEQVRQGQQMEAIGQLASGIAHDFNNLLTAILASADFAMLEISADHPAREDLEQIRRSSERAAGLTAQLLAFGRRQVLQPRRLDLHDVVGDVVKMLRRVIGEDIDLVTVSEPGMGCVLADPGQVGQVLMNLAVNARDAMPEGGRLLIEVKAVSLDASYAGTHLEVLPGRYMMLMVSDNGAGMSREIQSRIFEPFFTTKERGRGTGLGLSTVFGIVKQSGGSIFVYSEPGEGTTFRVYLPQVEGVAERQVIPRTAGDQGGNETILLVDDEEVIRDVAARILRQSGYRVIAASGPDEALALLSHTPRIDMVMTDVVMPAMNGRELVERLLQIRPTLKVLFTSGYSEGVHLPLKSGDSHAYLAKPFSSEELRRMVRSVLDACAMHSAG
ncbi:MAG: PAS domain S-box protein [Gemmatimonadota bacterium]